MNRIMRTAPDELLLVTLLTAIPGLGQVIVIDVSFSGDVASCEKLVVELLNYGTPVKKVIHPEEYVKKQQSLDENASYGKYYYNKDAYFNWNDDVVETIFASFEAVSFPGVIVSIHPLGGAISRDYEKNSAFAHRQMPYVIAALAIYQPADREKVLKWGHHFDAKNFKGLYSSTEEVAHETSMKLAYGSANLPRLQQIKKQYDPENVFKHNFNILLH